MKITAATKKTLTTKAVMVSNDGPPSERDAFVVKMGNHWVLSVDPVHAGAWGQFRLVDLIADNSDERFIQFGTGWKVTNLRALVTEARKLTLNRDHLECV